MPVHVHVERVRDGETDAAVARALPAILAMVPRERPVTLFAAAEAAAVARACLAPVAHGGRTLTEVSRDTIALSPGPGLPTLRIPRSWVGSTLLLVSDAATLAGGGARSVGPLGHSMAAMARGAGFIGPDEAACRAGGRLTLDVFAAVAAIIHIPATTQLGGELVRFGSARVVGAALPRDARSPAALDTWLCRKAGLTAPGPAGISVRIASRAARLPWTREAGAAPRRTLRGGPGSTVGGEQT